MSVAYAVREHPVGSEVVVTDGMGDTLAVGHQPDNEVFVFTSHSDSNMVALTYTEAVKLAAWLLSRTADVELTEALENLGA